MSEQVVVGIGDDIPTQAPAPHQRLQAGAQRPQPILGNPTVDPSSVELVRGGVSGSGGGLGDRLDDVSAVGVWCGRVGERGEGVDLGELAGDVDLPAVEDRQGVGLRPLVGGQQQSDQGQGEPHRVGVDELGPRVQHGPVPALRPVHGRR